MSTVFLSLLLASRPKRERGRVKHARMRMCHVARSCYVGNTTVLRVCHVSRSCYVATSHSCMLTVFLSLLLASRPKRERGRVKHARMRMCHVARSCYVGNTTVLRVCHVSRSCYVATSSHSCMLTVFLSLLLASRPTRASYGDQSYNSAT